MIFTRGHALLVGAGALQQAPYRPLPVVERDVAALAAALTDPTACGYPPAQVRTLAGPAATAPAVLAALHPLTALDPDDTLLLYLSGYAEPDADDCRIATYDAEWSDGGLCDGAALRASELLDALRRVPARLLLIANLFTPGDLAPPLAGRALIGAPLPAPLVHAALLAGEGRIVFTAAGEGRLAYLGDGDLSPFAHALLDALTGKTIHPRGGVVGACDLCETVQHALVEATRPFGLPQEPELTTLRLRHPLPVALWQAPTRQEAQPGAFVNFGTDGNFGDVSIGDVAGRDIVKQTHQITNNVAGDQRNISAAKYIEASTAHSAATAPVRGNNRGAAQRDETRALAARLRLALADLPPEHGAVADALAALVETAVTEIAKQQPDPQLVEAFADGVTSMAAALAAKGELGTMTASFVAGLRAFV